MLKVRLIPCLLLQNGVLVRSQDFSVHQPIGDPYHEVARFSEWAVDELIYLDITRRPCGADADATLPILDEVARSCFMPLTFGGGIRTLRDIRERISRGADKVTLNTKALEDPDFIVEAARAFGSQAIVVSIDARR